MRKLTCNVHPIDAKLNSLRHMTDRCQVGSKPEGKIVHSMGKLKQLYHRTLLVILFCQCIVFKANSQNALVADIIIFGTKHYPNSVYNSDSLMKAVVNLKPDVILIEEDSMSYTFKTGAFRPLPDWSMFLRRIGVRSKLGPEDDMLQRFHRQFPQVVIKPYDVAFNGKERDIYREKTLQLEDDFAKAMFDAYEEKEMSDYRANVHAARRQMVASLSQLIDGRLQDFNTDSATELVRQLETLEYMHFKALVDSVASLKPFATRVQEQLHLAEHRNEVMVQQILRYATEYSGKRIIVLTGLLHRYYQLDRLAPKRAQLNFRLLDINGEEMTFAPQPLP